MRPITVTVGPLAAASANNIATSQTPGAAGPLTLNGSLVKNGVAIMDSQRRVLITTADTTHSFTITGATPTGTFQSEVVTSGGTNVQSALDYATVTSIVISGAATGAVTVGTSGVASSSWVRLDEWANSQTSIQCNANGTVNYTVQSTMDDPNSATSPVVPSAVQWVPSNDADAVNATSTVQTNFQFAPIFARVVLNSGNGSVVSTFAQSNVANR